MNARTSARQYANALFDVATRIGRVEQVQRDLAQFTAAASSHEELRRALTDRGVPEESKVAILRAVFERLGSVAEEVPRLVLWLAGRGRLMLLPEIDAAFTQRVLEATNVVHADVTTTVALGEQARASLRDALGRALGRQIVMTEHLDQTIIGGIVAKVGSVVFDGSVTRQIERVREQLLAGR